jgi:hypothetical protein
MSKRVKVIFSLLFLILFLGAAAVSLILHVAKTFENTGRGRGEILPDETMMTVSPSLLPNQRVSPTPLQEKMTVYPRHEKIMATMFWVGEEANAENDFIPNHISAWDEKWLEHFGGVDTPDARRGYYPKAFVPKENPFYIALPYTDIGAFGRKENARGIPWFTENIAASTSLVKNRWVKISYKKYICYGQWEDVGPSETDDFEYVFGSMQPIFTRAGIDLSPAVRTCLKMTTNDYVSWEFVDDHAVPDGPWQDIITTSQINW